MAPPSKYIQNVPASHTSPATLRSIHHHSRAGLPHWIPSLYFYSWLLPVHPHQMNKGDSPKRQGIPYYPCPRSPPMAPTQEYKESLYSDCNGPGLPPRPHLLFLSPPPCSPPDNPASPVFPEHSKDASAAGPSHLLSFCQVLFLPRSPRLLPHFRLFASMLPFQPDFLWPSHFRW